MQLESLDLLAEHHSRNPFGEEGRIRTVNVSNSKAAIAGRAASKLPIHQGNTPITPRSGTTPEESLHASNELVADGSRVSEDGQEVGGDGRKNRFDQDKASYP